MSDDDTPAAPAAAPAPPPAAAPAPPAAPQPTPDPAPGTDGESATAANGESTTATSDGSAAPTTTASAPRSSVATSSLDPAISIPHLVTLTTAELTAPTPRAPQPSEPVPSVLVHRPGTKRHVSRASLAAITDEPDDSIRASERPGQLPWSRLLLALTVAGPALWLGGVPVGAVPAFLAVVLILWLRLCSRGGALRVP